MLMPSRNRITCPQPKVFKVLVELDVSESTISEHRYLHAIRQSLTQCLDDRELMCSAVGHQLDFRTDFQAMASPDRGSTPSTVR